MGVLKNAGDDNIRVYRL